MGHKLRLMIIVLLAIATMTAAQDATSTPGRIRVRAVEGVGEFYNTASGETFVPRGVNYIGWHSTSAGIRNRVFDTVLFDAAAVRADFHHLAAAGYNTVRLFFDSCNTGPSCIGRVNGTGLNADFIANIAEVIQIAADEGVYLLLTSNDLPDEGGYWDVSNQGMSAQFAGYRNAHYLTESGVASAEHYWRDFMTALMALDPPTEAILGWSILNEQWFFKQQPPLSLNSGSVTTANGETYDLSDADQKRVMLVDGVIHYIDVTSAVIREYDPGTLVTMGFFTPQFPNATTIGGEWYVDTEPLLARANLDFFDFHAYPGLDLSIADMAENFGIAQYPQIPVLMGEVGAFRHIYASADLAAIALQEWIAASCTVGYDGWLLWEYQGAPLSVGDATWGSLAADELIFNALAPIHQPDPCQTTDLRPANIAFRQQATASRSLAEEPPMNVTDGSANQWGSGADAPQWLEIDLGGSFAINRVTLRVAQYPAGETRHQVWALMEDGIRVLLREFKQVTNDEDLLEVDLAAPLPGVTGIRVDTLVSPSWVAWKEIEVFEGGVGASCVVRAGGNVNLRSEATTSSAAAGTLAAGSGAIVDQKTQGADGFTWYHLPHGVWLREDVVSTSGDCAGL